jgi:hypothetical protein
MPQKLFREGALFFNTSIGVYQVNGEVPKYQWFIDLLALKYGQEKVRVATQDNFGRAQKVAVYYIENEKEYGFAIPLFDMDSGFDINDFVADVSKVLKLPERIPAVRERTPLPEIKGEK